MSNVGHYNEEWVKEQCEVLEYKGKGTAFDIGANIGKYTGVLSDHFERVFAFEPFPATMNTLKHNMNTQKTPTRPRNNITFIQKAVANECTTAKMWYVGNGENIGGNSISKYVADEERWGHKVDKFISVETTTIDNIVQEYNIQDLKFMKVDVEGAENFLFEGAINTLRKFKLDIILEVHKCVAYQGLSKFFHDNGYKIFHSNGATIDVMTFDTHYLMIKESQHQIAVVSNHCFFQDIG